MKRIISFTLALAIMLTMCLQITGNANAAEAQLKQLPQVGEVISGFETTQLGDMDLVNAKTVLFEHKKTGAKLLFIQNDDINRSFEIAFKTPAVDNTGVNHILEHSTISGSQKYPFKDVFFTIANQTYSTYANAGTGATVTDYPVASMSEDQLLKLADVYLDCTLNPAVRQEKNIFNREAWRYELNDKNSLLNITGIVYNEMKGSLGNVEASAYCNVRKALFPDSIQSNISGGDPEYIKNLTYEQLIKTHDTYYQPSNSLMILYGNVDYTRFLKMIDENYLSKLEKKDVKIETGKVEPFKSKIEREYKYPVSSGTNTKNASQIDYAFALTDVSEEESVGLSILVEMLNQPSSELQQSFKNKGIGGSLSVSYIETSIQPVLMFSMQNADASKKQQLKSLVDNSVNILIKNGLNQDAVDAMISQVLLSYSALTEYSNLGVNISSAIDQAWSATDDLDYFNNFLKNIKAIQEKSNSKYFEGLTQKYINNNNHAALVATVPEAGLAEKQDKQLKEYLAKKKAAMTDAEIENLIKATKDFNEWNKKEDDPSLSKKLQAVTAASLPEEIKQYEVSEKSIDGIKVISSKANVAETGTTTIMFDTSAVPVNKLHYLQLYTNLLGKMGTKDHNQEQLSILALRYLNGASFMTNTIPQKNSNVFTPVFTLSWMGLNKDYDKALELANEILNSTDFTKTNDIYNIINAQISSIKSQMDSQPHNFQIVRNLATLNDEYNYRNYLGGIDYYNFLLKIEQLIKTNPNTIVNELNNIRDIVLNKTNMITTYAGSAYGIKQYESKITAITKGLKSEAIVRQDYSVIPKPSKHEGIELNTSVQYNMISAAYDQMGISYDGKYLPIRLYIQDNYTTPKIRFQNGAYANILSVLPNALYVLSYRDPCIRETFDIYKGLPDFLKNTKVTQEELDEYILKAFSNYTLPSGELSGATSAINDYLMGTTFEDNLKVLKQIKSAKVQDIKDMATVFESFIKQGSYSTVANAQKLTENKDLYDTIINVGNEQNKKPVTRAELISMLFPGVKDADKIAIQQGFIIGNSKGNYYMDKTITKQELAVILSRILKSVPLQKENKGAEIKDINSVDTWAKDATVLMVETGIMKLDDQGRVNPDEEVSSAYLLEILEVVNQKASGN